MNYKAMTLKEKITRLRWLSTEIYRADAFDEDTKDLIVEALSEIIDILDSTLAEDSDED